ncbi:MAG: DUF748 domain-containing protein [Pseudomonadota bacterium]|nr:DUF748 domain-containing protein [Pseudomonadota bacterium]
MNRIKLVLAGVLILSLLVVAASFILVPTLGKSLLLRKAEEVLQRPVAVDRISLNPATLALSVRGITIGDREEQTPFLTLEELQVNLAGFASLARRALILDEFRIVAPRLRIVRLPDGAYNFSDLLPRERAEGKEAKAAEPLKFSLNNIEIQNGGIDFDDRPRATQHRIREMNLAIPFISNLDYHAKRHVEPLFSALINDNRYLLKGRSLPFSPERETTLDLEIRDLDLPHYLAYIPVKTAFKIPAAKLDANLALRFLAPPDAKPTLRLTGRIALREVMADDLQRRPLLRLPKLEAVIAALEPLTPAAHLSMVTLTKPEVIVRRDRDGVLQLAKIFPEARPEARKAVQGREGAARTDKVAKKEQPSGPGKFLARIDRLSIAEGAVTLHDEAAPAGKAQILLAPIRLQVEGFSTAQDSKAQTELELTVDRKGLVALKGPVGLDPLGMDLEVALRRLPIRSFQPYFADKARLNIVRGGISATGKLTLAAGAKGVPPLIGYTGQMAVGDFAARDQDFGNDFLKWRMLSLDGMEARSEPFRLHVRKIGLRDYFVRAIINADGSLNLRRLAAQEDGDGPAGASKTADTGEGATPGVGGPAVARPEKPAVPPGAPKASPGQPATATAAAPAATAAMPDIRVGRVDLDRGVVDFTDNFIKPNFSARMRNLTGSVAGLSSEEIARAAVKLRGNLERGSDILIEGRINPLIRRRYADINMKFKDIELSPATPYASKYLGHPILKGKLTFEVSYLVEDGRLNAGHKVFIDQLTLGDHVDSPEAIKAPVSLGVSLLKDRHGQINLDIPVTGSLDDPEFSVWPIVWQIVVNIFTKALTAPFALLASLGGDGEELSYIEFDPGSAALNAVARDKLSVLAKALHEKPNVRMDIEGHVDPVPDREGMKKIILERKIRERKLDDLIEAGEPAMPASKVRLAAGEYDKYLQRVYDEAKIPGKPRNFLGIAKRIPGSEMERLLLANTAVTDGDLRQLAQRRAEGVKELLLKAGPVEPGRIFLVSSSPLAPERKDKVSGSRVDFRLK